MNTKPKQLITKIQFLVTLLCFTLVVNSQQADDKSSALLDALTEVNGGYHKIASKKDVEFTYIYDNMDAGRDVSTERHIFNGEHSWGAYKEHARNVLPNQKGLAIQSLVHGKPALTLDGKAITDEKAIAGTVFLRKVNFYWFTMMYKLKDPGTNYTYLGTEKIGDISYDKVSLMYDADITKKEKNDEYILYFNPNTHLIDLFFFSLPDWGIDKPILKMTLEYEQVDGIYLSTVRKSYGPNEQGEYQMNGIYTFKDIKFNNGFKAEDFKL
ncbi:DUF6503 family protein [Muriicola sp. Z0-33]|uniref:DUF6503 family protein n=1 Tax=Muriicola sp. Z0-33 TaxID=2816957 RepID=UPI002237835D|nr:DUF6503 family protein [Muriicola sp. Z0-33]MCW5515268.1 hypothetical protein [Muriicola sp. Z0-33]